MKQLSIETIAGVVTALAVTGGVMIGLARCATAPVEHIEETTAVIINHGPGNDVILRAEDGTQICKTDEELYKLSNGTKLKLIKGRNNSCYIYDIVSEAPTVNYAPSVWADNINDYRGD